MTPLIGGAPVYGLGCSFDDVPPAVSLADGTYLSLLGDTQRLQARTLGDEALGFLGAKASRRHTLSATSEGTYTVRCRVGAVSGDVTLEVGPPGPLR